MPAAAVIPAPIAYIEFVAVKKLVVGVLGAARPVCRDGVYWRARPFFQVCCAVLLGECGVSSGSFTLKKLECSKQAGVPLHSSAWDNRIRLCAYFVGF